MKTRDESVTSFNILVQWLRMFSRPLLNTFNVMGLMS